MKLFSPTIVSGCVRCCELMVDSIEGTPGSSRLGDELAVVSDKGF